VSTGTPRWDAPQTVAGFETAQPNRTLLTWAQSFVGPRADGARPRLLDLGCGAARNAVPLAEMGFRVVGLDLSAPMLDAARRRTAAATVPIDLHLVRGPMAPLPFRDGAFDVVVAHGVWNLARSDAAFRHAVAEAARVARPGAGLFLFTFSRGTLAPAAAPVPGETYAFTQFSGEPQIFLTEAQVLDELGRAGFRREPPGPMTELNRRSPLAVAMKGPPVIWEATFVRG